MVFFKKLDLEETSRELLKMILGEEKKKGMVEEMEDAFTNQKREYWM